MRHLPSGIVGTVEKIFAAGEHPTATCEVVALSTGDELVFKPENFEPIGMAGRNFWQFLLTGMTGVVKAAALEAQRREIDPALFQPLVRAAIATVFAALSKKN